MVAAIPVNAKPNKKFSNEIIALSNKDGGCQ